MQKAFIQLGDPGCGYHNTPYTTVEFSNRETLFSTLHAMSDLLQKQIRVTFPRYTTDTNPNRLNGHYVDPAFGADLAHTLNIAA